MLVVDASVLAVAIGDDGPDGDRARARLRGERLAAPELVDLEVTSVLRRQMRVDALDARHATLALGDLSVLPVQRAPPSAGAGEYREGHVAADSPEQVVNACADVESVAAGREPRR